jgi:hypothetical protein
MADPAGATEAMNRNINALVRRYAADRGWHILSVCQPQHLFRKDPERRHSRVAAPTDPWQAAVGDAENQLYSHDVRYGVGATPDDAVIAAIPRSVQDSLRRCEIAVDNLRDCLSEVTSRGK